jgi:hypothetical protein
MSGLLDPPYGYVQINNVSYRQPNGSLELSQTYLSGYGGVALTNASMIPPVLPIITFEGGDCPTLVYAAWGRIMILNDTYFTPTYFIYWLSGSYHFEFKDSGTGYFRYGGVFPDGAGYETSSVPIDTEWHWFAVRVIDTTELYDTPSAAYGFYIDGVQCGADIYEYPEIYSDGEPVYPTTFLTVNYGAISFYSNWQIDYLRTSAYTEYPPQYPALTLVPVDPISGAMVLMGIGLVGAMLDVVTPVYVVETFMDGNYIEALGFGFMGLLLGTAFIIAWLW